MHYNLVDRVVEVVPSERIVAIKAVSRAEEYLGDHFPTFPVLPGVLMLEAMVEAARWLAWASQDFEHSLILLHEAKNVTYKNFVKPGQLLRVDITCRRMAHGDSEYAGAGLCEDREVVKGRFTLTHLNLQDKNQELAKVDARLISAARSRWAELAGHNR
ncbi:MAG: 3-hydroxyacyl-ACP dehydratase FabZ family protein [Phycisphaerae bacterium]